MCLQTLWCAYPTVNAHTIQSLHKVRLPDTQAHCYRWSRLMRNENDMESQTRSLTPDISTHCTVFLPVPWQDGCLHRRNTICLINNLKQELGVSEKQTDVLCFVQVICLLYWSSYIIVKCVAMWTSFWSIWPLLTCALASSACCRICLSTYRSRGGSLGELVSAKSCT